MIRALVLAAAACYPLALASGAHAGTYTVNSCLSSTGGATGAFSASNNSPQTLSVSAGCPPASGQQFTGLLISTRLGQADSADGADAAWTITAPPGTSLRSLAVQRYFGKTDPTWAVAVRTAEGTVLDTCDFSPATAFGCSVGLPTGPGTANAVVYELHTSAVSFGLHCNGGPDPCPSSTSARRAWIAIYAATATVEDRNPPVVAPLTGSLAGPGAVAGWHRGVEHAVFSASDASGVSELDLVAGGTTVASRPQVCDFTRMQPCPGAVQAAADVDTAGLPDGTYPLRVVATDAALQQAVAQSTLKVDQHPPTAPLSVAATPNADGTYAVTWTDPDQGTAAPIVAAHYVVCAPDGTCAAEQTVTGNGVERIDAVTVPPLAGTSSIRVWLEDEAGNADPASAAQATVDAGTAALAGVHAVGVQPPVLLPSGRLPSPRLRVTKAARSGSALVLSGTIERAATGTITARLSRTSKGPRTAQKRTKPKRGRWSLRIHLTSAARRASHLYLALSYEGGAAYRKTTLHRRLTRRTRAGGKTTLEFSSERQR